MAAHDKIINLIQEYFIDLGYNHLFVEDYFSERIFKELLAIRLANANVTLRNKTDKRSHQTHIAVTGEAIDYFYRSEDFEVMDNKKIDKHNIYVIETNIKALMGKDVDIADTSMFERLNGYVTIGKRTQKQVQLSKKNAENSEFFNTLRLGLYENDLLIMLKYRGEDSSLVIGIPQVFYLDVIPNYANKYETNTYLRIPQNRQRGNI